MLDTCEQPVTIHRTGLSTGLLYLFLLLLPASDFHAIDAAHPQAEGNMMVAIMWVRPAALKVISGMHCTLSARVKHHEET